MSKDSINQNLPIEIGLTNPQAIVPAMDEPLDTNDSPKTTVIIKTLKYPKMNLSFFFGFVGTILIGSFHYGSLLLLNLGFDLSVYGSCFNLYITMYDWNDDQIGKVWS
jgi:hypothetical protein